MKKQDMKSIVLTERPEFIEGNMDFDQIVTGYRRVKLRKTILQYGIPLVALLTASLLFLKPEKPSVENDTLVPIDTLVEAPFEQEIVNELTVESTEPVEEIMAEERAAEEEPRKENEIETPQDSYNPTVPVSVFTNAEPVAGYESLYLYFDEEIQYPDTLVSQKISGTVVVRFAIGKDGRAEQITVEKSLHELLDQEAIRLIREMPVWKPATANGEPIVSFMSIPITFNITNHE